MSAQSPPQPAYISFTASNISEPAIEKLMAACCAAVNGGTPGIHLLITTFGGNVPYGITVFNFLRALPVPVTTYNMGNVASVGNLLYLGGTRRVASPHSTFFFHPITFTPAAAPMGRGEMMENSATIERDTQRILHIVASTTGMGLDRAAELHQQENTVDAQEAKGLGVVHEIQAIQIPQGAILHHIMMGS